MIRVLLAGATGMLLMLPACAKIEMTHKVEPIHMIVDINIRVDRQLEDFFAFEEEAKPPATQPATTGKSDAGLNPVTKGDSV